MKNNINTPFQELNAWLSEKPIKYWRPLTFSDMPRDPNTFIYFYEWIDALKRWDMNILPSPASHWTKNNINKLGLLQEKLANLGLRGLVIIEDKPKFKVGRLTKDIKVNIVHPSIVETNYPYKGYKIFEPSYQVTINNQVHSITESKLQDIMERQKENYIRIVVYKKVNPKKDDDITGINVIFKTNHLKKDKQKVLDILNTPHMVIKHLSSLNSKPPLSEYSDNDKWKIGIIHYNVPKTIWNLRKKDIAWVEYNGLYTSYIDLIRQYKELREKVLHHKEWENPLNDSEKAFLSFITKERTFSKGKHFAKMSKKEKKLIPRDIRKEMKKILPEKKQYEMKNVSPILEEQSLGDARLAIKEDLRKRKKKNLPKKERFVGWHVVPIQPKNPKLPKIEYIFGKSKEELSKMGGIVILTYKEFTNRIAEKQNKEPVYSKLGGKEGMPFVRNMRRYSRRAVKPGTIVPGRKEFQDIHMPLTKLDKDGNFEYNFRKGIKSGQ